MKATTISNVKRIELDHEIPDGIYPGTWGGYRVRFAVGRDLYEGDASDGIRTPKADCYVTAENGNLTVRVR